jgi:flavin reductase (DIM6/NTAB) family NADH-FMN oxidoreductase RutF
MSVTEHQFRRTMSLFPTGVTVVTTPLKDGQDVGLTISSLTSVSLEPPQILFCLSNYSRAVPVFQKASHFAINILNAEQAHLADAFARHIPQQGERLKTFRHEETGCLLFSDAMGHLVCEKGEIFESGDHYIIIGHVIAVGANFEQRPLVRQTSQYQTIQSLPVVEVPLQEAV